MFDSKKYRKKIYNSRIVSSIAIAVVFILLPEVARAQESVEVLEGRAMRAAVERVAPSVVQVETVGGKERVGKLLLGDGPTTGLVVESDGYIISSAFNFVGQPQQVFVRFSDGARRPAKIIATDFSRMMTLLKVEVDQPLEMFESADSSEIRVGQWAIAVGRVFEIEHPNMAVGIVSAVNRIWGKAIQTDAAVSPNNYGGPLIDIRGRVLGLLVPLSPKSTEAVAGFEWYDSGIGFAIPIAQVMEVLPRLKQGSDLIPGFLGVSLKGKNPAIGESLITAVAPKGPADAAGIKKDDRIVEIEGRPVVTGADVQYGIAGRYVGDKVSVVVLRDEKRETFEVTLAERPKKPEQPGHGMPIHMPTPDEEKPEDEPQ